ncbi:MAG: DUF4282 domain-containing protein [Candidatus Ratteibacteria bacterium]
MFCTKCGTNVKEDVKVCPECGAIITPSLQAVEQDRTGLLQILFDSSFNNLLTLRIIRFLYKIAIFISILAGIVVLIGSFFAVGLWGIIVGPILGFLTFVILLIIVRTYFELVTILFKIAENTSIIAKNTK